jgi:hypothetical protein
MFIEATPAAINAFPHKVSIAIPYKIIPPPETIAGGIPYLIGRGDPDFATITLIVTHCTIKVPMIRPHGCANIRFDIETSDLIFAFLHFCIVDCQAPSSLDRCQLLKARDMTKHRQVNVHQFLKKVNVHENGNFKLFMNHMYNAKNDST